jgi:hypothetical protein
VREQARAAAQQAARLLASQASLTFTQLDRVKGANLLEQAFGQVEDNPSQDAFGWLIEAGDEWTKAGQTSTALRVFTRARAVASPRSQADPPSAEWQRALAKAYRWIGDTLTHQGKLTEALTS